MFEVLPLSNRTVQIFPKNHSIYQTKIVYEFELFLKGKNSPATGSTVIPISATIFEEGWANSQSTSYLNIQRYDAMP